MMRPRPLTIALALAALAPAAAAQTETVTFTKRKPQVGDRRTDHSDMSTSMAIEITLGGEVLQTMEQSQVEKEVIRTTFLEKDGDSVTGIELHWLARSTARKGPGGDSEDESPLAGQTVVVKMKDGEIVVTDTDGEPVDAATADAARTEAKRKLGDPDSEFSKVLPDRPIEIGEKIEVDPDVARQIFSKDGESPFAEVTMVLTLTGREEHAGHDCGAFDIEMTLKGEPSAGMKVAAGLSGKLLLGTATSWPHALSLAGNIELTGTQSQGGQEIGFTGGGPMNVTLAATYELAK